MSASRPQLVSPKSSLPQALEMSRNSSGGFDVDAFHVMDERDNALIADEVLNGAGSNKFVYNFDIAGKAVSGISVIGARHLASHYGGIKHSLIASVQKTGSLFVFTSFPRENVPMQVTTAMLFDLESEPDFYSVVIEIQDIKSGNSVQIERRESRYEKNRNGDHYERPNFSTIAQSKAYRNGVLAIIPQDVQIAWKQKMLLLGKAETITGSVIEEKRSAVLRYASTKAIPLDRHAIERLTMDQIAGLADAARENMGAFVNSAKALGLEVGTGEVAEAAQIASPSETSNQTSSEARKHAPPKKEVKAPDNASQAAKKPAERSDEPPPPSADDYGQAEPAPKARRQSFFED